MFSRGLKTNIVINMAIILILAMLMVDFVMTITAQRDLVRSEQIRGDLLLSAVVARITRFNKAGNDFVSEDDRRALERLVQQDGSACLILFDHNGKHLYIGDSNCRISPEMTRLVNESLETGKSRRDFSGRTWAVFWHHKEQLIFSAPLIHDGQNFGAVGVVIRLGGLYRSLRNTQKVLLVYMLINTLILTIVGFYRLSKVYLQPVYRLVKRAESYRDDEDIFFSVRKEDNELGKLSTALNRMLKRIGQDRETLRSTVKSLEKANADLQQAQNEIIQAEKLASVGRLSSGIAHEIGNPIGIVIGYLDLLKQTDLSTEQRNEFILRAEAEINRISKIIRQLLDLSRSAPQAAAVISVHEIIQDITAIIQAQPIFSDIDIQLFFRAPKDTVHADPDLLRQVFLNLIINAADAVATMHDRSGGKLNILTEILPPDAQESLNRRETIRIRFADNGPGISPENIANVFDPFYTTKEPGKGTGLGLSVSYMIIEAAAGKIKADSEPGRGTTMTLLLPIFSDGDNEPITTGTCP